MKYSNRLRNFAVSALAIGCLGNYGSLEAMQSVNEILSANTFQQKINCQLAVKVKVDFKGTKEEFSLFDGQNKPIPKNIPFTIEGMENPKIIMEIVGDSFKFIEDGKIKVVKSAKNDAIDESKAPEFNVKVTGPEFEENFVEQSSKYQVELSPKTESIDYKIVITPSEITNNTSLGEYKTGNLKFSIISE